MIENFYGVIIEYHDNNIGFFDIIFYARLGSGASYISVSFLVLV